MDTNWREKAKENYLTRHKKKLLDFVLHSLMYHDIKFDVGSLVFALPKDQADVQWFIYVDHLGKFRLLHFSSQPDHLLLTPYVSPEFEDIIGYESAVVRGTTEVYWGFLPTQVVRDLYTFYRDYFIEQETEHKKHIESQRPKWKRLLNIK